MTREPAPYNLHDANGRYRFRSKVPVGYSVPLGGSTDKLLTLLDRHGTHPAHIHFFVAVPGHRKLTTQINIDGDPYLGGTRPSPPAKAWCPR